MSNLSNSGTIKSDALLLLTAAIWGFAFVAQRVGMAYVGPFTFNGVRFALGCVALLPLIIVADKKPSSVTGHIEPVDKHALVAGGIIAGFVLFAAASLQQVGLVYTTAGKAGFITGLYVVIVPVIGHFLKQPSGMGTWVGAISAAIGLYFLSMPENLMISFGDFLELLGAFLWAAHVLILGYFSPRVNSLRLAFIQFATCSLISLMTALLVEEIVIQKIMRAAIPILYGGIMSVGVAYTLQVVSQKKAKPSHAAILLSLEAVFAVIGGWLILNETLSARGIFGCGLMMAGMLFSQLQLYISPSRIRGRG
jgi:drug/metabolite transporter (DMT)-like permease